TLSKMVKAWIFAALALAQFCIPQAEASHYIRFVLLRHGVITADGGICIHDGQNIIMAQRGWFASSVQNYGFHNNGFHANVNWNNKEVGVAQWNDGPYKFQNIRDDGNRADWS
ncbi:hypothetical protein BGZ97_009339, partial [Linnemannia gamsii]